MDSNELKFLLKLLGCENYRSPLAAATLKSFPGKDKICRVLGERELVDYSREIASVKILPPGLALLKMDASQLPIGETELKVLEKISKTSKKLKPSEITLVKAAERQEILQNLAKRGLVEVETQLQKKKAEVWLTQRGQEYLRDEFTAKGTHPIISLDLLTNYLRFLRKTRLFEADKVAVTDKLENKLSDAEIFQVIQELDREMGTENYLPIFHVRQKLQPPLSREELDQVLYRLQRYDQIELSSLVDTMPYTSEQIDSGIPQDIGGALFFISVTSIT
ncbi:MAG: transcription factor RcaD [Phormidium sp.]